jgi:hypothetical protein
MASPCAYSFAGASIASINAQPFPGSFECHLFQNASMPENYNRSRERRCRLDGLGRGSLMSPHRDRRLQASASSVLL